MTTRTRRKKTDPLPVLIPSAVQMLSDAFVEAARICERETGKKPELEALEHYILAALCGREAEVLSDLGEERVSECKLKTKKRTSSTGPCPGDVYAVPLLDGNMLGYVKIVKGRRPGEDLYVELLRMFSKKPLTAAGIKKRNPESFLTVCADWSPVLSGVWKKCGSLPFDEEAYQLPDFYGFTMTFFGNSRLYYISRGKANDPAAREEGVSREEAEAVGNPDGVFDHHRIAEWLYREFLTSQS
ncbi:Imm26 family immunity protein [Staphylospora marina]|uniref:Imm26 family immunity protein n=1 Tax=Staphylospora marina TaxID=2490858 RepID=UPI000F5B95BE|nr:Imm26 family immunity protein [Staphylospora marina]